MFIDLQWPLFHRKTFSMFNVKQIWWLYWFDIRHWKSLSVRWKFCHSTKCLILYHFALCTWCCITNHFRRIYIYISLVGDSGKTTIYVKMKRSVVIWDMHISQGSFVFSSLRFSVFRLLTDFVCLYTYEFWLSLSKIVRSSVILLLPLLSSLCVTSWALSRKSL